MSKVYKTLIGIEKVGGVNAKGKPWKGTILHMLENGSTDENLSGQRVIKETVFVDISDVNNSEVEIVGVPKLGSIVRVFYEGEGNFKKCSYISFTDKK